MPASWRTRASARHGRAVRASSIVVPGARSMTCAGKPEQLVRSQHLEHGGRREALRRGPSLHGRLPVRLRHAVDGGEQPHHERLAPRRRELRTGQVDQVDVRVEAGADRRRRAHHRHLAAEAPLGPAPQRVGHRGWVMGIDGHHAGTYAARERCADRSPLYRRRGEEPALCHLVASPTGSAPRRRRGSRCRCRTRTPTEG